jgi:periplasmic protein TonB
LSIRAFIVFVGLLVGATGVSAADPSLRITEADAKKSAIEKCAPVYPPVARQLKVTGRVVLEAVVNETGAVDAVRPLTGNPILTKPAVDAVKKWKFKPFQADGKAVAALVTLSFEFDNQ